MYLTTILRPVDLRFQNFLLCTRSMQSGFCESSRANKKPLPSQNSGSSKTKEYINGVFGPPALAADLSSLALFEPARIQHRKRS